MTSDKFFKTLVVEGRNNSTCVLEHFFGQKKKYQGERIMMKEIKDCQPR